MEGPERDACFPAHSGAALVWVEREGQGGPAALPALSSGTQDESLLSFNPSPPPTPAAQVLHAAGEGGQPGPSKSGQAPGG